MKKLLLYVSLIFLIVLAIWVYNYNRNVVIPGVVVAGMAQPWQPVRLRIDSLHINAPVMNVGETADGRMDAPVSTAIKSPYWTSVFWYQPGPAPGQVGNAVIAGHVDRVGGDPAIFWYLGTLQVGASVIVITRAGTQLHFVVNSVVHYPASAPGQQVLNSVFGPTGGRHLNLITCSGVWTGGGYDERLVVFTTLVGA